MKTFIHSFKGNGIIPSKCKVYIKKVNNEYWIGFESMNEGTSITNATEQLATEIIEKEKLDSNHCRFFEWYPEYEGSIDEISYIWGEGKATNPQWKWRDSFIKEIWNK